MKKHRCGGCGSDDGVAGFTIGQTLCMGCRRERQERRAAYYIAQRKKARQDDLMALTLIGIFVLGFVAMIGAAIAS